MTTGAKPSANENILLEILQPRSFFAWRCRHDTWKIFVNAGGIACLTRVSPREKAVIGCPPQRKTPHATGHVARRSNWGSRWQAKWENSLVPAPRVFPPRMQWPDLLRHTSSHLLQAVWYYNLYILGQHVSAGQQDLPLYPRYTQLWRCMGLNIP